MRSKKAIIGASEVSEKIGYLILALMLISTLIIFLGVLVHSVDVNFFKSNYGSSVVNLENKFFNLVEYKDPVTFKKYSKVLDLNKINSFGEDDKCSQSFSKSFGVTDIYSDKGIRAEVFYSGTEKIISTCNYYNSEDNFKKIFPVLIFDGNEYILGEVTLFYWHP